MKCITRHTDIPALLSNIIQRDVEGLMHDTPWEYRQLHDLIDKSTRPEITFALHLFARFSPNHKFTHKHAMMRIGRYLMKTKG